MGKRRDVLLVFATLVAVSMHSSNRTHKSHQRQRVQHQEGEEQRERLCRARSKLSLHGEDTALSVFLLASVLLS